MPPINSLAGKRIGLLTVISKTNKRTKDRQVLWECLCDCGNKTLVRASWLKRGRNKSCGCYRPGCPTHSASDTRAYISWSHMLQRCYNQKADNYKHYGGRGIKVCDKWRSFSGFYADMGERPAKYSLERIDNDGDYCKQNCRWATQKEQGRNVRTNKNITINKKTSCIATLAEEYGMDYETLRQRITKYKWTAEKALNTPVRSKK